MTIEIVTGVAAEQNVAGLPANVMMYGGPGTLKTTDAFETFVVNGQSTAFAIPCEDGALKILVSRGMPIPDHPKQTVKSWGAMQDTIAHLAKTQGRYRAVVIDGYTPFSSYLYNEAQERFKGGRNKFDVPVYVRQCLFQLREWIRMLGMHSVFIAHSEPPAVQEGTFYPGSMKLSPRSIIREYFGQLDTVLRVDYLSIPGQAPVRVYHTGGEIWPSELGVLSQPVDRFAWLVKNREGCNQAVVPANLGAFLRQRQPPYQGL